MRRGASLVLITLVGLPLCARADEESDRRRAISDAERLVSDMARALSSLAGDSSDRGVDDALRSADRLRSTLRDLDRVKGNDSKAREMVSRWPRNIDRLKDVRRPLETLKKHQRALKNGAEQCKRQGRELEQFVEREVRKDSPSSARAIEDKAKGFARGASDALRKGDDQRREMERAKDDARRFDGSDGNWRDVRSRIQSAAERMYSDWQRDFEATKRACEGLAKGERHPAVQKGLEGLERNRRQRTDLMKRAQADLNGIVGQSRGLDQARDAGPIKQLGRALSELQRRAQELDRVKGGDPEAARISASWPRTAANLAKGLDTLATMKQQQFGLAGAAKACGETEKRLAAQAKAAAEKPEAASRDALKAEAAKIGAETSKALDAAKRQGDGLKSGKDQLGRLSGDGPWSQVVSNLREAGAKMTESHGRDLNAMQAACGRLAQGEKHPEVAKALDAISKVLERVDRLFKELAGEVKTLAGRVKSAGGARDASDVDQARASAASIQKTLEALSRDPDPRAQARSKAWLAHFRDLDASLKGLDGLKRAQGELAGPVKACEADNKRLEGEAKQIGDTVKLAALEKSAEPLGKTAAQHLSAADGLVGDLGRARTDAVKFGFSEGEWGAVKGALKASSDAAFGAFEKDRAALKAACTDVAKGAKHPALVKARADLDKRIATAKAAVDSAGKASADACGGIKGLLETRAKRMQALAHFVKKINEEQKLDTKPSLLQSLKEGIERAEKDIADTGKRCATAMEAHAKADTAWEALQGR